MRKSLIAAAAGAGVFSLVLATLPLAQADPIGPPTYRKLAGGGSDTTQSLMNALAAVVKDPATGELLLGSYDAVGSATVTTKDPATDPKCQNITRPNGSTAGRNALQTSLQAQDGCFQWARSSSSRGTYTSAVSMTWVPFATDALTFAVRSDGDVPRELTRAELIAIFKCEVPSIQPALVQVGSGTRDSWLDYVGIPRNFDPAAYPCLVPRKDGGTFPGNLPQEHDGRELKKNQVMPYSAAVYQAQIYGTAPDRRGKAVIGVIDGIVPTIINNDFGGVRTMFNIIPTSKVTETNSLEYKTFVGRDSLVCQAKPLINLQGFGDLKVAADCGSTASRS